MNLKPDPRGGNRSARSRRASTGGFSRYPSVDQIDVKAVAGVETNEATNPRIEDAAS